MKIPRIIIAGTGSGCGKTTISMGIMSALSQKGYRVQPFKVGPDYIDPMFHTHITGRYSRNLDSWMLGEEKTAYLFGKNASNSDIAVIEGVMGLYDGLNGRSSEGSTAHVAAITKTPVILVIDGEAMSLSAAAVVKGFVDFDRNIDVKGVIINNIYGEGHYRIIKEAVEGHTNAAVLGYLEKTKDCFLEDRHLGLVTAGEILDLNSRIDILTEKIRKGINLDLLVKIAATAPELSIPDLSIPENTTKETTIAIAMDKAFNFYYRDSLDLLESLGAKLIYFSPMEDNTVPENADGVYIGGGYPEIWAGQLEENIPMKESLRGLIKKGLPVYAECGGLMYLGDSIELSDCKKFDMAGVIHIRTEMTNSLQHFGYVRMDTFRENILAAPGQSIRAHEFHFSRAIETPGLVKCFRLTGAGGVGPEKSWECGYRVNNVVADYPHIHFWSNPGFAERFVQSCRTYGQMGRE
ncbi:MAG: cobyrinate a,c-diamide synthase [Bacillota bacterium]|nr:cobyrinate a,c-diamide synthase [Bacillota bacterium]